MQADQDKNMHIMKKKIKQNYNIEVILLNLFNIYWSADKKERYS